MKKNFLKIIFAMTMGVSLFSWKSIGANVNAEPNNTTLPSGYEQISHVNFSLGSIFNTGYCLDSSLHDIEIVFHYKGSIPYKSFGTDVGGKVIQSYGSNLMVSSGGVLWIGTGLNNYYNDLTTFDLKFTNGTSVELDFNGNIFNGTIPNPLATTYPILFGYANKGSLNSKGRFNGAVSDFSAYEDNILVKNYVACKQINSGDIGFYETVSNTFVTSSNSYGFYYLEGANGVNVAYKDSLTTTIYPLNDRLYLGSHADFSNMDGKLLVDNGAILTGTINDKSITVGVDNLDLTKIFGEMEAGTIYPLTINDGVNIGTIEIIKSSNVANLYITGSTTFEGISESTKGSIEFRDGNNIINDTITKFVTNNEGANYIECDKRPFILYTENMNQLIPAMNATNKYSLSLDNNLISQAGLEMYSQITGSVSGAKYRMINLYYNNEFIGLYSLKEYVEISNASLNITEPIMVPSNSTKTISSATQNKTAEEQAILDAGIVSYKYCPNAVVSSDGGFVLECGHYADNGKSYFVTSHGNKWRLREPETASLSQITKIAIYIQKAENALFSETGFNSEGKNYADLYDLDSLAKEFLVQGFIANKKQFKFNDFIYIDGDNSGLKGKIYGGPIDSIETSLPNCLNVLYDHNADNGACHNFREELLKKGDFIYKLYDINLNSFSNILNQITDANNTLTTTIYDLYSNYLHSRKTDDCRWQSSLASISSTEVNNFVSRKNAWTNIWSDESDKLRGVTIHKENNSNQLTANAISADSYQWYKINTSDYSSSAISGATSSTYTPEKEGIYYVEVTGDALAGCYNSSTLISNCVDLVKATISFNMQGHGEQVASQEAYIGYHVIMPSTPYESGCVFKGWYKEADCTNRWNFTNDTVAGDVILYAKWVQGGSLFTTSSVSLCDNTWLNTYTELVDDDYQQYTFKFKIRDGQVTDLDSSLIQKVNHKWRLTVILLPYQLADDVTFYMYDLNGHLICTKVDSVRSYGTRLLANSTDANEKNAMIALLNYGAAVQILKGYHVDDLANRDVPVNP